MASDVTDVSVVDNADEERFEIRIGDQIAGFTQYRRRPGLIAFIHTEIEPQFEGHGAASHLIREALDTARSEGLAVLPFCPFVRSYIGKHPEYLDLVREEDRGRFGLG